MEVMLGYKQTEVGAIPEDWETSTVRDIASNVRNAIVGGPFGSDLVSNDYVEDGVPVIRGQNMGHRFLEGNFVFVTPAKASSLQGNLARPGDLVFTQRGTLGQVSLVPNKPYDRYLVSQSQMKLTLNLQAADPLFFYYLFSSAKQQAFIRENTIQTGVPHINLGILRSIPVQKPALAEQHAIAMALSDADALIDALEQLVAKKRQIKHGAMHELLTGQNRLPGFATSSGYQQTEVGVIPEDWEATALGQIATVAAGGTPSRKVQSYWDGGIPWVTTTEINFKPIRATEQHISALGLQNSAAKLLRPGTLLLALYGQGKTRGKVAVLEIEATTNQACAAIVLSTKVSRQYVFHCLASQYDAIRGLSNTGSQENLSGQIVKSLLISLPPTKAEQEAIGAILSDMDVEIAALEAKLAKARQVKQGMMQELLTGRIRLR